MQPSPEQDFYKDREAAISPCWAQSSLLGSSILCHTASQQTWTLILSECYGTSLTIHLAPTKGCSTHVYVFSKLIPSQM